MNVDEKNKAKVRASLRQYQDFPCAGILFEDILPIFRDPETFQALVDALKSHLATSGSKPDVILGLEARGFLFGPVLALQMGCAFVPARKKGKLPGPVKSAKYVKEYGEDVFEIQADSILPGQKVVIVDDIIATGGSAAAAENLVHESGGYITEFLFLLELGHLKARDKLKAPVHTLLTSQ